MKWVPDIQEPPGKVPCIIWVRPNDADEFHSLPRVAAFYPREGRKGPYFELALPWKRNFRTDESTTLADDDVEVHYRLVDESLPRPQSMEDS